MRVERAALVLVALWLCSCACSVDGAILPSMQGGGRSRTLAPRAAAPSAGSRTMTPGLPPPPPYEELYFTQTLDHFNLATQPATYRQRYLLAKQYWNGSFPGGCPGPIFFYTGNEAPVTDYYSGAGFFTQVLAPAHNALLVFAEHRYFGESMPFGDQSFDYGKINYLSPEQALADYARLLTHLKATLPNAQNCPVFAFGGSYGGMLTTWFRLKYPNIVMGGLAASAPFAFYGTGISPYAFTDTASDTFAQARDGCAPLIKKGFAELQQLATYSQGWARITQAFRLCTPIKSQNDAFAVINWVDSGLIGMAMLDYPFPTNYGISLPAWPVNRTCDRIIENYQSQGSLVDAFAYAIGVFYNNTGSHSCYDINRDVPDWGKCCGWDYLHCSEVYLPSGSSGIFPPAEYSLAADIAACRQQFNVTLRPEWGKIEFGGFDLKGTSHIIFSNGLLDPWHTSGVLQSLSDTLIAIVIPEAAHHLDLWAPSPEDPIYVQQARQQEAAIIDKWLKEYWADFTAQH